MRVEFQGRKRARKNISFSLPQKEKPIIKEYENWYDDPKMVWGDTCYYPPVLFNGECDTCIIKDKCQCSSKGSKKYIGNGRKK